MRWHELFSRRELLLRWSTDDLFYFDLSLPAFSSSNGGMVFFLNQKKRENQRNQTGVMTFKPRRVKRGSRQSPTPRPNGNCRECRRTK